MTIELDIAIIGAFAAGMCLMVFLLMGSISFVIAFFILMFITASTWGRVYRFVQEKEKESK